MNHKYTLTYIPDEDGRHEVNGRKYTIRESGDIKFGNAPHIDLNGLTPQEHLMRNHAPEQESLMHEEFPGEPFDLFIGAGVMPNPRNN